MMEFSVKRNDLLEELDLTQGVVERKTTIPILSNLLVRDERRQAAHHGDRSRTEYFHGLPCESEERGRQHSSGEEIT